jgi:hypothetical protein
MQIDVILEVAIGLVVVWFVLSMATSQIQEFIADIGGKRSKFMRKQIEEMFQEQGLNQNSKLVTKQFYSNALIESLKTQPTVWGGKLDPAEISAPIFAQVISFLFPLHSTKEGQKGVMEETTQKPTENVKNTPLSKLQQSQGTSSNNSGQPSEFPQALKSLISGTHTNPEEYKKNIETWFEIKMKNAISSYRKEVVRNSFIIGLLLALAINADSLYIANRLWTDPTLRQAIVAQAENLAPNDEAGLQNTFTKIKALSLPLVWTQEATPKDVTGWLFKGVGIFLTALATAQGSPFWFDVLRKLIGAKSDMAKPSQSTQPTPVG